MKNYLEGRNALKRCFENIIQNGLTYGKSLLIFKKEIIEYNYN